MGSGTKISNVYVVNGSDDGIEFFGGSVNIDHCLVENCTDDSFDWTEGWNGTAEYIVAYQSVDGCDCLMECDNNGDDASAETVSDPVIRYATFVGMDATDKTVGIKFRAGTFVNMSYALVCGKTTPITLETPQTSGSFEDGDSSISHSVIAGELSNKENGAYDNAAFLAAGNSNRDDIASSLTDGFVGTIDGAGAVSASSDWTAWTR